VGSSRLKTLKDPPVGAETAFPMRLDSRISTELINSSFEMPLDLLASTKLLNSSRVWRKLGGYAGQLMCELTDVVVNVLSCQFPSHEFNVTTTKKKRKLQETLNSRNSLMPRDLSIKRIDVNQQWVGVDV
jgi:hypothetical protein